MDSHRTTIARFTRKVTVRMDSDGYTDDTPLYAPLAETVYATQYKGLREHENHTKSNYLINLAEAICAIFTDLSKYHIAQHVISPV